MPMLSHLGPRTTWSGDQADIDIPDGPDHRRYTREMP